MEARKIIITGGATRIGAAIAKKLSGPNIEIVIHYNKSKSKAEKLKKELKKNGTIVYLVKADLGSENDVDKIIKFSKLKLKYLIKFSKSFNKLQSIIKPNVFILFIRIIITFHYKVLQLSRFGIA